MTKQHTGRQLVGAFSDLNVGWSESRSGRDRDNLSGIKFLQLHITHTVVTRYMSITSATLEF